jgi:hypothetical protein
MNTAAIGMDAKTPSGAEGVANDHTPPAIVDPGGRAPSGSSEGDKAGAVVRWGALGARGAPIVMNQLRMATSVPLVVVPYLGTRRS